MKASKWGRVVLIVALGLVTTAAMAQTGFDPPAQLVASIKKWTLILVVLACIVGLAGGAWDSYRGRFDRILSWVIGTVVAVAGLSAIGLLLVPAINNALSFV